MELTSLERSVLHAALVTEYIFEVTEWEVEHNAVRPADLPARIDLIAARDTYLRALSSRREFLLWRAAGSADLAIEYANLLVAEEDAADAFRASEIAYVSASEQYLRQRRRPQLARERLPERAIAEILDAESAVISAQWRVALDRAYRHVYGAPETSYAVEVGAAWKEAEELAARFLRTVGFPDADVTVTGADGGFDVVGRGIVAQVKYLASAVGRPDVQRLVGANQHGARMAFFSRAGYAAPAVQYAELAGVALFTVELPGNIEPANAAALQMIERA